jgi:DNA repair protein RadA
MSEVETDIKPIEIETETTEEVPDIDFSVTQLEGVGAMTEKKLTEFGVSSLIDICIRGAAEVAEITGVAKAKADAWVFASQKILEDNNLIRKSDMGTIELMEYQDNYPTLESKCTDLDNLIGGGVKPEAMYEVYGLFGSGKTQFCNSLTVEAIHDEENVVWIDCEDTFKPKRIVEILMAREYVEDKEEAKTFLERINYFYTPNTEQLMGTINSLSQLMQEKKPRILVLDGAIGQFREEFLGRGTLAARQNQIARLMTHLKNISYYFRTTVIFTNQVQSDPAIMFGDPIKPIGGNIVGHASTYRIYFKKAGKKRIARMVDSPEHPQADAEFALTAKGVDNLE